MSLQHEIVQEKNQEQQKGKFKNKRLNTSQQVLSRREDLNFPALQSMLELTETELQAILDKLPPADCTTC